MDNVIGLDKDNISLEEAKALQEKIHNEENATVLLWQTQQGFHLEIIYKHPITMEEKFKIREKHGDCERRMYYSKLRKNPHFQDVLFSMKDGHWRELIW